MGSYGSPPLPRKERFNDSGFSGRSNAHTEEAVGGSPLGRGSSRHFEASNGRNAQRNVGNIRICVDIPYNEHPYLIGPRGVKCKHVMDKTNALIHFPDVNRLQGGPKINHVLLYGSPKSVEEARTNLRNRTPLTLTINIPDGKKHRAAINAMESAIISRQIPIKTVIPRNVNSVMLKAEWSYRTELAAICDEFLADVPKKDDTFQVPIPLLPLINPGNIEVSSRLVKFIREKTGARVQYPPLERYLTEPPTYFVTGRSVEDVVLAVKHLIGLTMVEMKFEVPKNYFVNERIFLRWKQEFLVEAEIEAKGEDDAYNNLILRTFEFRLDYAHRIRATALGMSWSTAAVTHEYGFMESIAKLVEGNVFDVCQLYFPRRPFHADSPVDCGVLGLQHYYASLYGPQRGSAPLYDSVEPESPTSSRTDAGTIPQLLRMYLTPPGSRTYSKSVANSSPSDYGSFREDSTVSPSQELAFLQRTWGKSPHLARNAHFNVSLGIRADQSPDESGEATAYYHQFVPEDHDGQAPVAVPELDAEALDVSVKDEDYVMVDSLDLLTNEAAARAARAFKVNDGIRVIVGYCIPAESHHLISASPPAKQHLVRPSGVSGNAAEVAKRRRGDSQAAQMNAVDSKAFQEMLASPYTVADPGQRCRFAEMRNLQSTAAAILHQKFGFSANPHLIPFRLPDGLHCYLQLNLAANQFSEGAAMAVPY